MYVWGSIVISTTIHVGLPPTLNYLSECELRCNSVEVIVVRDSGAILILPEH